MAQQQFSNSCTQPSDDYFCTRTKSVFRKNSQEANPQKIRELIDRGNYVTKEIEALYKLKKYRTLKRRYYS